MATIVDKLVIALGLDTSEFDKGLNNSLETARAAGETAQSAAAQSGARADAAAAQAGAGSESARRSLQALQGQMAAADAQFDGLGKKWAGAIQGFAMRIAAPITAAFAVWKGISTFTGQVAEVATLTGGYSQKLEEWRIKRAMLSRITREDIELYRKSRESVVGFQIAMQDLTAKIARQFSPALKWGLDLLDSLTKWISRNEDNLVRFFTVAAGVITAVFLPALIRMGAALLMNPLTWIIAVLGALILIIDDLTTYTRGGTTALGGFWSIFGTGEEVGRAIGGVLSWLKDTAKSLLPYIAAIAGAFAAFKMATTAVGLLMSALNGLRAVMLLLMANPIVAAIAAVIAIIVYLYRTWQEAGGSFSKFIQLIIGDLANLGNKIRGIFNDIKQFVVSVIVGIAQAIADYLSSITFEDVLRAIGSVLSAIGGLLADAIGGILGYFADLLGFGDEFRAGWDMAISLVGDMFNRLGDIILSLPGRALDAGRGMYNALSSFVQNIVNTFTGLVKGVADSIAQAGLAIGQWLISLPGRFVDAFTGIADSIRDIFAQLWAWIVGTLDPTQILNKVKGAAADLFGAVKGIFGGDEDEEEGETEPAPRLIERPRPQVPPSEPAPSNGVISWANGQAAFDPNAPTQTQNIQTAVNNNATYNSSAQSNASVQQTNNITINAGNADPQAMRQAFSQEMALQNDKLQRQTMAVETGTRI